MLSILIATYNFNSVPLVNELNHQLIDAKINYEILCYDDASKSKLNKYNHAINSIENCTFLELDKNLGRSAIRNLLAKKAKFNWLIFLDGDVMPASKNFIQDYSKLINENYKTIYCGGVQYEIKPENQKFLHYKHGRKNEEISVDKRNQRPFKYFFTSNFLIHKSVFSKVVFEERLTKYGREDMLFAIELKKNSYDVKHLDNAIYHLGIEEDDKFIRKTKQAMENLIFLEKENLLKIKEAKLLRLVKLLKRLRVSNFTANLSNYFENRVKKNQSLFFLDCLKVSYLCKLIKK